MKKLLFFLLLIFSIQFTVHSQDLDSLIRVGIALHDEGKFDEAIAKYEEIISKDNNHYLAHYEKSLSLLSSKKLDDCIEYSRQVLKKFPDGEYNSHIYVNMGTAYDLKGEGQKSVEVYNEGIEKYPGVGLLYFNKAITLYNLGKGKEAFEATELSIKNNPYHASSHNVLAVLTEKNNKVLSLLASLFFLGIEPTGKRATYHIGAVEKLIGANVEKTGEKTININISMPDDNNAKVANDFSTVEMSMSLSAALNFSEEFKNETRISRMKRNIGMVFSSLVIDKKEKKKKFGIGWEFYAPFFAELKNKELLETFCYVIYASTPDDDIQAWLENNPEKIRELTTWYKDYWKK